jgi:uncharacterized protein YndB with AHSA1/START domain
MTRVQLAAAASLAALALATPARAEPLQPLRVEIGVAAPIADVWDAWTTSAGAQTFFGPRAHIELARGGAYDVAFQYDAARGQPHAEGLHVLSYVPGEMISFEWAAPTTLPAIRKRGASSFVVIQLTSVGPKATKVVLHHLGWAGEGAEWTRYRSYFQRVWPLVLGRLQRRFAEGKPIDFTRP